MQKLFILLLGGLILPSLYAEDLLKKLGEKAFLANINTLLVFTSQDGLSTGEYHFSKVGTKMYIANLPFLYHLQGNDRYNWFVLGNVGYSRVYLSEDYKDPRQGIVLTYDNHIQTYTAGFGGGIRYHLESDLALLAGVELIYSRAGVSVKPRDPIGGAIEEFFNSNYNDNLTYKFLSSLEYRPTLHNGLKPYLVANYKIFDTKLDFTFTSLSRLSSQSSTLTLAGGIETPALSHFGKNYSTFEAYYHYDRLFGSIEDIVKFGGYSTVGGVFYYYTPKQPAFASRFFLEASSVFSSGLEGYNVGVGFTVDF